MNAVTSALLAVDYAAAVVRSSYYLDFAFIGPVRISRPVGAIPSATSNFRVGSRGAAWWEYTTGAGEHRACSSQGLSVVKGAQTFLRNNPPAHGGAAMDGNVWGSAHMADHTAITSDGVFGPATCKSLWKYLSDAGVDANLLADLRADFEANNTTSMGRDVSRPGAALRMGTLRALLWASAHSDGDLRRIAIPAGTLTPVWGVASANDGAAAGIKTCWNAATEDVPSGAGGSASQPIGHPSSEGDLPPLPHIPDNSSQYSTTRKAWIAFGVIAAATVGGGVAIDYYRHKHHKR